MTDHKPNKKSTKKNKGVAARAIKTAGLFVELSARLFAAYLILANFDHYLAVYVGGYLAVTGIVTFAGTIFFATK